MKIVRVKYSRSVPFYGRNRYGRMVAVQIEPNVGNNYGGNFENQVILRPIYENNRTSVTEVSIPKEDIPKFIEELQKFI